jgi:hypothetical protein
MDFINAQIRAALHRIPLWGHSLRKATISITAKNDRMVPAKGNRILWRKLPMMISKDAQMLPMVAAFSQESFIGCLM